MHMSKLNNAKKRKRKALLCDLLFIILLVAFDHLTKYLAVAHLKDKQAFKIINGVLELNYLENKGAAFGMLQNQGGFFVFVAIIVLGVIAYILYKTPNDKKYNLLHIFVSFATVILVLALLFYYKESDLSFISFNQKKYREL